MGRPSFAVDAFGLECFCIKW